MTKPTPKETTFERLGDVLGRLAAKLMATQSNRKTAAATRTDAGRAETCDGVGRIDEAVPREQREVGRFHIGVVGSGPRREPGDGLDGATGIRDAANPGRSAEPAHGSPTPPAGSAVPLVKLIDAIR